MQRLGRLPRPVLLAAVVAILAGTGWALWLAGGRGRLDPPPPTREADGQWVPDLPVSTLMVPIRYDLAPVVRSLEDAVPPAMGSIGERIPLEDNDRVDVAYEVRRDPFQTSLIADRAMIGTVLHYRARAWYDPPVLPEIRTTCGSPEEPLRAVVSISARLWLSDDWLLRSDGRVDHIGPLADTDRDRCQLTALGIDVTDRVMAAARTALEEVLPSLERSLAQVDLRSRFERWWGILEEPIHLTDDTWLVIGPEGVHRGATYGTGDTLTAEVGLSARPRIVYGARPVYEPVPLPNLGDPLEGDGLHINASGTAEYAAASQRLTRILSGRTLDHQGQTLQLERIAVEGIGGGRLSLDVYFSGSARGHIYLVGTPEFDRVTGEVFVPDLAFDVDTRNLLLQGYAWLAAEEILGYFRQRARWPIDDLARFAREQLLNGLNRSLSDEVRLEGAVDSVRILGVYPLLESFVVQARASARASLIIAEVAPKD